MPLKPQCTAVIRRLCTRQPMCGDPYSRLGLISRPLNDAVEVAIRTAITPDMSARAADSATLAAALSGLFGALVRHLEPLIGGHAVRAIYGRSVDLAASEVPWIAASADVSDAAGPVQALRGCLEDLDSSAAIDGARVLMVTFVELLARVVGEGLAARLIAQAWPCAIPDDAGRKAKR